MIRKMDFPGLGTLVYHRMAHVGVGLLVGYCVPIVLLQSSNVSQGWIR
jgi:hypothetical protein